MVGCDDEDGRDFLGSELLIYMPTRARPWLRLTGTCEPRSSIDRRPCAKVAADHLEPAFRGKTTTATNTAISLAQTGARYLIIDADMRRPRLHSIFNIGNDDGLSTLLSSELTDDKFYGGVKQDDGSKLFLLPSGPIPPNPAELIGSEQMATLFTLLQTRFTHVVVTRRRSRRSRTVF